MAKIFESPDGGKTVYARESGETERTLIKEDKDWETTVDEICTRIENMGDIDLSGLSTSCDTVSTSCDTSTITISTTDDLDESGYSYSISGDTFNLTDIHGSLTVDTRKTKMERKLPPHLQKKYIDKE